MDDLQAKAQVGSEHRQGTFAQPNAIVLDPRDNVAVALRPLNAGDSVTIAEAAVILREPIKTGHKLALRAIPSGSAVIKYNESIGIACADIAAGEHVHVHNLRSARLPAPQR